MVRKTKKTQNITHDFIEEKQNDKVDKAILICASNDLFLLESDVCVLCATIGNRSGVGMIACCQCGECYHDYCLSKNFKITHVMTERGWRCPDCIFCNNCEGKEDDEKLILCDDCDIGYHIYCLLPPLKSVPEGEWICDDCQKCQNCGNEVFSTEKYCDKMREFIKNFRLKQSQLKDRKFKTHLCNACISNRFCMVCFQMYNKDDNINPCFYCSKLMHVKCNLVHYLFPNNETFACTICLSDESILSKLANLGNGNSLNMKGIEFFKEIDNISINKFSKIFSSSNKTSYIKTYLRYFGLESVEKLEKQRHNRRKDHLAKYNNILESFFGSKIEIKQKYESVNISKESSSSPSSTNEVKKDEPNLNIKTLRRTNKRSKKKLDKETQKYVDAAVKKLTNMMANRQCGKVCVGKDGKNGREIININDKLGRSYIDKIDALVLNPNPRLKVLLENNNDIDDDQVVDEIKFYEPVVEATFNGFSNEYMHQGGSLNFDDVNNHVVVDSAEPLGRYVKRGMEINNYNIFRNGSTFSQPKRNVAIVSAQNTQSLVDYNNNYVQNYQIENDVQNLQKFKREKENNIQLVDEAMYYNNYFNNFQESTPIKNNIKRYKGVNEACSSRINIVRTDKNDNYKTFTNNNSMVIDHGLDNFVLPELLHESSNYQDKGKFVILEGFSEDNNVPETYEPPNLLEKLSTSFNNVDNAMCSFSTINNVRLTGIYNDHNIETNEVYSELSLNEYSNENQNPNIQFTNLESDLYNNVENSNFYLNDEENLENVQKLNDNNYYYNYHPAAYKDFVKNPGQVYSRDIPGFYNVPIHPTSYPPSAQYYNRIELKYGPPQNPGNLRILENDVYNKAEVIPKIEEFFTFINEPPPHAKETENFGYFKYDGTN